MVSRLVPLVAKMSAANAPMMFIVQDGESGLFLTPVNGDVGFTQWAHRAGRFFGYGEACDTADQNCHEGYFVTRVASMPNFVKPVPDQKFWDGED